MASSFRYSIGTLICFLAMSLLEVKSSQLRGKLFECAWQVQASYERCNQGTIDQTARYTAWVSIPQHKVYRLSSPYPADGRYFVFTMYDTTGANILGAKADFEIKPSWSRNPYVDPSVQGHQDVGGFDLYIIYGNNSRGYENEIIYGERDSYTRRIPVIIIREYGLQNSTEPSKFVPDVHYLEESTGQWHAIESCTTHDRSVVDRRCRIGTSVPLPNPVDLTFGLLAGRTDCATARLRKDGIWPQFNLRTDGDIVNVLGAPPVFTNSFSEYMYWCQSQYYLDMKENHVFLRIRGRLPTVSTGLFNGERKVANDNYTHRYLSFTTADLQLPSPVFTTIDGLKMETFYNNTLQGKDQSWDRSYTLIASFNPEFPKRCGMYDESKDMYLSWTTPQYPNGAENPILVFREIMPQVLQKVLMYKRSMRGTGEEYVMPSDVPNTMVGASKICQERKTPELCYDKNFLKSEVNYCPELEMWRCDPKTGVATQIS